MRLRNRKTYLRKMQEDKSPKRSGPRVFSTVYILFLLFLASIVLWYVFQSFFFVVARGQIILEKHIVRAENEGVIAEIRTRAGEKVRAGDKLFSCRSSEEVSDSIDRDIVKVQDKMQLKNIRIAALEQNLDRLQSKDARNGEKNYSGSRRLLDISLDIENRAAEVTLLQAQLQDMLALHKKIDNSFSLERSLELVRHKGDSRSKASKEFEEQVLEMKYKIAELERTIQNLKDHRKRLHAQEIDSVSQDIEEAASEKKVLENHLKQLFALKKNAAALEPETIVSTVTGRVYRVYVKNGAFIREKDVILSIIETDAEVFLEGYFEKKYLDCLHPGKEVRVEFPDGKSSLGVIDELFSAASSEIHRIRDKYIPIESELLALIRPFYEKDQNVWKKYDRMDVKIRAKKWRRIF